PTPIDLGALVHDGVTAHLSRAEAAGVVLRFEPTDQTMTVLADPSAVRRVVDVLVENAVKFSDDGGRVDVRVAADGRESTITVHDDGIGVSVADQEVIFDEFRQAEAHYTHKREGTGLGLALARRMVELHQGRIWVDSTPGEGSVFAVAIPSRGPNEGAHDDG
ncbi:MAG: HAMP domain-containing histidine kinase, partial [Acidimicrobiia bacterium]|nr:HAMP domain-containing histidine kinase [Acidimicrobiia bacterium]